MKKVSGGTPPDENVSKNTQKNVFRSIRIREQISEKKYSEKHLPLQNPLERGGLGGAHLDIYIYIYIYTRKSKIILSRYVVSR